MKELFVVFLTAGIAYYFIRAKAKQEDSAREATFRATMLGLEEKAKREGTFVMSYFDKENK